MCGIAGVWNLDARPVTRAVLERMTRSLTHRGPDGEGYYIDGALGLGHRRLAIIDLSTAASQPMDSPMPITMATTRTPERMGATCRFSSVSVAGERHSVKTRTSRR